MYSTQKKMFAAWAGFISTASAGFSASATNNIAIYWGELGS